MSNKQKPDLGLFLEILQTLERIEAPYMMIGAFAGIVYGITRVTYDIDIVVDLTEQHIQALASSYLPPRYYADAEMMRNSIELGILFNIIDTNRGEKADLVPLTSAYEQAFQRRIRQMIEILGAEPFDVWCARPEDVIIGKLMAWAEGRSRKHETDIYDMMVFQYLGADTAYSFDDRIIDQQAARLGTEVAHLWLAIKEAAKKESSG